MTLSGLSPFDGKSAAAAYLRRPIVYLVFALGLALRLATAFLYGTQDVEFWKAFGTYAYTHPVATTYGADDSTIMRAFESGLSRDSVRVRTEQVIEYDAYKYSRKSYLYVQPPVFLYALVGSTAMFASVDPALTNNRIFNFFVNLPQILASAAIALVLYGFGLSYFDRRTATAAALLYWMNPVVLLNSPIQGYLDPLCALFAVIAVWMIVARRLTWSMVFLVLSFLTKPQGVLIAPVLIAVGVAEHGIWKTIRAMGVGAAAAIVACAPFLVTHHGLSMVQGVLQVTATSHDLSRQALNVWWPVQYTYNVLHRLPSDGSVWHTVGALLGRREGWDTDVPTSEFSALVGFNVETVGLILLAAFVILNLRIVLRGMATDRRAIVIGAALQFYGYFILRVGVQVNHYFLLIPILALVACTDRRLFALYLLVSLAFFVQDLTFYGFGRDLNPGRQLLSHFALAWLTVAWAIFNAYIFWRLTRFAYVQWMPRGLPERGPTAEAPQGAVAG